MTERETIDRHDQAVKRLKNATTARTADRLRSTLQRSMDLWQLYRDGVARACRIERPVLIGSRS